MTKVNTVHGKPIESFDPFSIRASWRKIPGLPELQASNMGKIRDAHTKQILKVSSSTGYNRISFQSRNLKVAHLIATAFVPNPDKKPVVNHINGVKTFDAAHNLEWVTHSENTSHAIYDLGYINNFGKVSVDVMKNGEIIFHARTVKEAARFVDGHSTHVSKVCKGIKPLYKGFSFKYS